MDESTRVSLEMGGITLAVLTGVNTTTFRATATFLDTGGSQVCTFTPSGGHGEMPLEGSLCAVYRKGQFFCQFIKELNDFTPSTTLSVEQRISQGSEVIIGTVPTLNPGDVYIGRYGKAVFNSAGSVNITTQMGNMSLQLNDQTQVSSLSGNNYLLSTPDEAIRIRTISSIPSSYGDAIRIEKNIPQPYMTPGELAALSPAAIVPSLAFIEIDEFNAITAAVLIPTPAVESKLSIDELGNIDLGHVLASFSVDALGELNTISTLGTTINSRTSVDINAALAGGAELLLATDGGVQIGNNTGSMTIDPLGDVTISGDKIVGIEGLTGVTVTGATVNLNNGVQGVARIGDTVIINGVTDPVFTAYMSSLQASIYALYIAITTASSGVAAPYQAAMSAILATVPPPLPAAVPLITTGIITTGSLTVFAGD